MESIAPCEARKRIRNGKWTKPTANCCQGYEQANLVVLPSSYSAEFRLWCSLNSRPAPLLEQLDPKQSAVQNIAKSADIRSDLPCYQIHTLIKNDNPEHCRIQSKDISEINNNIWNSEEWTGFLLGCSFGLESALQKEGIEVRHITEQRNVPMFDTNIPMHRTEHFSGNLVVSMRPVPKSLVRRCIDISKDYPLSHGCPLHGFGSVLINDMNKSNNTELLRVPNAREIGISDLFQPNYGDSVSIDLTTEIPLFWPCGVSTQVAVKSAMRQGKLSRFISHKPGHMFISDRRSSELRRSKL